MPDAVDRYVVAVTGGDERKNTEGLLRAWGLVDRALRSTHHLVVATADSPSVLRRWERWAAEAGVADRVVFTGSIDDDEMVAILQGARLAVMPSVEEGFGLPVVEAAACGVPAICSNLSSLPEVLDEPSACFDPYDPSGMAQAIERALTDDEHRAVLLAAGERASKRWTWGRVAADTIEALTTLGPRWPQRTRAPRPRLAIAGPFAGSASAIGAYDESIIGALAAKLDTAEIVAFVDGSGTAEPTLTGPQPANSPERWPVRSLGRYHKPWDYDHVVAVLGSSPHHVATADLALRVPCHVWLHEASLVGVHLGLAHASGSESWALAHVREVLESTESPAVVELLEDDALLDAPHLDALGVTLLADTLRHARSVIVSSERGADVVRSIRSDGPPLLVLPLAYPDMGVRERTVPQSLDIVAVGWLAPNKAPAHAVEVLARLVPTCDARLTFVGPTVDSGVAEVESAADRLGVTDRVTVAGRLDDDEYRRRVGGARVGLQLRSSDRGEMSAAVTDLVALGTPTLTALKTAAPSSPGLTVVDYDIDAIVAALVPLLTDDAAWHTASSDALARAGGWGFADVAQALRTWIDDVDQLDPSTIRRAGPLLASPAPHD